MISDKFVLSSLQRRFPIDDVLLRSGDIRDQVAKLCEIAQTILMFLGHQILREKGPPKFLTELYKSGSPSNTWPSDLGD